MNLQNTNEGLIVISFFVCLLVFVKVMLPILRSKKKLQGKASMNSLVFNGAKLFLGLPILVVVLHSIGLNFVPINTGYLTLIASIAILILGTPILVMSLMELDDSTRIGLPLEETRLKTKGIYSVSRNPMYLGVYMLGIASALYLMNTVVWILLIIGMVLHHKIILKEEEFLRQRFGSDYEVYCKRVNRYFGFGRKKSMIKLK